TENQDVGAGGHRLRLAATRADSESIRTYVIAYDGMAVETQADVLGPRIRALRDGLGLSLRELAQRSGVSAPMLSQVERGDTSPAAARPRSSSRARLRSSATLSATSSGPATA